MREEPDPRRLDGECDSDPGEAPVLVVPLAAGDVFSATVVSSDGETAVLGLRGGLLRARCFRSLDVGSEHDFAVRRVEPEVVLEILAPRLSRAEAVPPGTGFRITELIRSLGAACDGLADGLVRAVAPRSVLEPRAVARSLAEFEQTIAMDLPPQASELARELEGLERENARRAALGLPLRRPMPVWPEAGLLDAARYDSAPRPDGTRHVLLLEVDGIGKLRVDLDYTAEGLLVELTAPAAKVSARLFERASELRERLSLQGPRRVELRVRLAREGIPSSDLKAPAQDDGSLVDRHA
ncbi:MAG: hypothetical protein Fur0037_15610 [Planctomycetota bacterium]